jgi:hypothetical protein
VVILGGDSAYARFYFAARTFEERQQLTSSWIGFLGVWSVAVALVLLPFSPQIADWALTGDVRTALIAVPLVSVPIVLVNRMCAQVLRNEFRAVAFSVLNFVSIGLTVAIGLFVAVVLGMRGADAASADLGRPADAAGHVFASRGPPAACIRRPAGADLAGLLGLSGI